MLVVGGFTVIKRIMIPNYPELTVRRDIGNLSLQDLSTKYDPCDDRGLR